MSGSIDQNLRVYKLEDPLLDLSSKPSYVLERSALSASIREITTQNFSSSAITYDYKPSTARTIVSDNIRTKKVMDFTFTGDSGDSSPLLQLGSNNGFRMFNYAVQTATLKIDNNTNTYNESEVFPLMHRYMSSKDLNENVGYTFNTPDLLFDFDDYLTEGFGYNVNSNYTEQGASSDNFHGRYQKSNIQILSNTPTSAVVRVTFISPIMLRPCSWKNNDHTRKGLFGVEDLLYIENFKDNIVNYLFAAGSAGNAFDSITYVYAEPPSLLVQEFEVQPDSALPADLVTYPYHDVYNQTTVNSAATPAGAIGQIISSGNQLRGTPEYIGFYIGERDFDRSYTNPITALSIDSVTIQWDTMTILNNANRYQLYEICKKNGYSLSYEDWYYRSGGFVLLKLPTDIQVGSLDAVGRMLRHSLSVTVTYRNQTNRAIVAKLPLIISYVGSMVKSYNYAQSQSNIVTASDVINSENFPALPRDMLLMERSGGINIKDIFSRGMKILPKVRDFAQKCGPDMVNIAKEMSGSGMEGLNGVVGGIKARRSELRNRLAKY